MLVSSVDELLTIVEVATHSEYLMPILELIETWVGASQYEACNRN